MSAREELHPISARAGDLQRVQHEVALSDPAVTRNLEVGFGLAVLSRQDDVHHARTGAAREENLDCRSHDFGLRLAGLEAIHQRPESLVDDVHRIADFGQFSSLFTARTMSKWKSKGTISKEPCCSSR